MHGMRCNFISWLKPAVTHLLLHFLRLVHWQILLLRAEKGKAFNWSAFTHLIQHPGLVLDYYRKSPWLKIVVVFICCIQYIDSLPHTCTAATNLMPSSQQTMPAAQPRDACLVISEMPGKCFVAAQCDMRDDRHDLCSCSLFCEEKEIDNGKQKMENPTCQ